MVTRSGRIAFGAFWIGAILFVAAFNYLDVPKQATFLPFRRAGVPWSHVPILDERSFHEKCLAKFPKSNMSLGTLPEMLAMIKHSEDQICGKWLAKFNSIFSVTWEMANIVIPKELEVKMNVWLGGKFSLKEMSAQKIVMINNEVVGESMLFNELRNKRPKTKPELPQDQYIEQMYIKSKESCDFCNGYARRTAADSFGRLESKHAYTAANVFRLDKFHSMSVFRTHHPLNWTQEAFIEMFQLGRQWFDKAYASDPEYPYPVVYWDLLPRAGGSQIHPHIHMLLSRYRYPGYFEVWRRAALRYTSQTKQNYFENVQVIHDALGMSIHYGNTSALVSLNARRDYEIIFLSPSFGDDFFKLLYHCYQVYFKQERYAVSLGISLPPMNADPSQQVVPMFARMVSRGVASTLHTDATSMELFTIASSNVESFGFAKILKEYMKKNL